MRLLLDSHTFVWWIRNSDQLSVAAGAAIEDGGAQVFVSLATAWEMAIKVGAGKWPEAEELVREFGAALAEEGFDLLPITLDHVRTAGLMRNVHRDPFDRLLAAQAQIEGLTLVTADARLAGMGAPVVW